MIATTRLLEGDGIDTVALEDPRAALLVLERDRFDATITDLELPFVDGLELIRAARRIEPAMPVIAITGGSRAEEAIAAGASHCLAKPVDYCDLLEALNEATGRWHDESRTFRQLVENIREVFWVTTAKKDRLLYVSPSYEEVWGRPRSTIYHDPDSWLDVIHPQDQGRVRAAADPTATCPYDVVYRIVRPDGAVRWIHDRAFPVHGKGGEIERHVGVAEDVTELHETEAQLRHAQKMEAVGRLAGGVAHDFNNLLAVILSYVDLALEAVPADSELGEDLAQVRTAAHRAGALTRQLLMFSRREIATPEVLDVSAVLAGLEKMLRRLVVEDIEIVTRARSRENVELDSGHLEQVLMNLVVNARDAMPQGGTVTIETADVVIGDAPPCADLAPGRYVSIRVADTGVGMDAATKARIFEPFFTTKERGKGTGLGLSTVFAIVQQARGAITVESEPGAGTTFVVYLPRVEARSACSESAAPTPSRGGGETIMVVEDDDQVRSVMCAILLRHGYRVLEARSGHEAERIFDERSATIDLVLADVVMPNGTGVELARALRTKKPGTRVLLTSGYTGELLERHGSVGAHSIPLIAKPFAPDALTRKVREVLAR